MPQLSDWIGRTETTQGTFSVFQARMMAATLSVTEPSLQDPIPALWHWAAMPVILPTDALGHDGHPPKGGFLPPVALPRRMWAGGSVRFDGDLYVGEPLTRTSTIASISEKEGRAGPMVFVAVDHEIKGATGRVMERHDIVYLRSPQQFAPPPPIAPPDDPVLDITHPLSATLLFRYSACTFNGHRIHYDLDFARDVEKYPDIVVHGPLQATFMIMAATSYRGRRPDSFKYRGVHPMFPDAPLRVLATQHDGHLELCTARGHTHQGMQATAHWVAS